MNICIKARCECGRVVKLWQNYDESTASPETPITSNHIMINKPTMLIKLCKVCSGKDWIETYDPTSSNN